MKSPPKKGRRSTGYDNDCLRGLKAAAFMASSLDKSKDKEWIVAKFDGDEELVNMWLSFIQHSGWVQENPAEGTWTLTDKGRKRVNSLLRGSST